ncbi:hypothetical protein F441_02531 [Phytophthora nicotianae CJ01A1]|uniref:Uncharacterized protein n=1 Tax=Phytophthora nicotianae CJ01A1 TaxID=1317063 RepID=W2XRC4_PHYNI|nr:hypothetical protein F441_02531 [Phytophthora nicotianae CJ01A1]
MQQPATDLQLPEDAEDSDEPPTQAVHQDEVATTDPLASIKCEEDTGRVVMVDKEPNARGGLHRQVAAEDAVEPESITNSARLK